jgi:hypothetical protein
MIIRLEKKTSVSNISITKMNAKSNNISAIRKIINPFRANVSFGDIWRVV